MDAKTATNHAARNRLCATRRGIKAKQSETGARLALVVIFAMFFVAWLPAIAGVLAGIWR